MQSKKLSTLFQKKPSLNLLFTKEKSIEIEMMDRNKFMSEIR
jgi:hypothetical protein